MPVYPRRVRSLFSSQISALETKLSSALRKASCSLALVGVEARDGEVEYSALLAGLEEDVTDRELLEELKVGLADCDRRVQCLQESSDLDTRTKVAMSVEFLKCFQSKQTEACVKKSIKRKLLEKLR